MSKYMKDGDILLTDYNLPFGADGGIFGHIINLIEINYIAIHLVHAENFIDRFRYTLNGKMHPVIVTQIEHKSDYTVFHIEPIMVRNTDTFTFSGHGIKETSEEITIKLGCDREKQDG